MYLQLQNILLRKRLSFQKIFFFFLDIPASPAALRLPSVLVPQDFLDALLPLPSSNLLLSGTRLG